MNDLTNFNFNNRADIRVVTIDGDPWFVAVDVCRVLGLGLAGGSASRHLSALGDDEVRNVSRSNVSLSDVSFPNRGANCISESGLYRLVMRSDKPDAKPFQDWVAKVVLPAIRKDGAYIAGEEKVATGEMSEDEFVLKAMDILLKKVERLTAENEVMTAELNNLTVDEYRALRHEYWSHGKRVVVGKLAAELCKAAHIYLDRQERTVPTAAGPRKVFVNVYPRDILDRALSRASNIGGLH